MINSITTELSDYKVLYVSSGFRIELEYTLEDGSFPNFRRTGKIGLNFYGDGRFSNHFLKYHDLRFTESFNIFLDSDTYLSFIDLFRNESPVYFYCRISYSRRGEIPDGRHEISKFSFSTNKEQIGEDDLDETE